MGAASGPQSSAGPDVSTVAAVSVPGRGSGSEVLDRVRAWYGRFIEPREPSDLDLVAVWTAHTWCSEHLHTTPRLRLDSPVPESGKTTTLEHMSRLCRNPEMISVATTSATLTRIVHARATTLLIDETDRNLHPDRKDVNELLMVVSTGYRVGGTRTVNVPVPGGGWAPERMSTFAPTALAGNNADLPGDILSRCITMTLLPDADGRAEATDWELIEDEALALAADLAAWVEENLPTIKERPPLPDGIRNRDAERWRPLKRVAMAGGGRWPDAVDAMALADLEERTAAREEGLVVERPAVALIRDLRDVWEPGATFTPTDDLLRRLAWHAPETWGAGSRFGKPITSQRLGRMLAGTWRIQSTRVEHNGRRGYLAADLTRALRTLHLPPLPRTDTGDTTGSADTPQGEPTEEGDQDGFDAAAQRIADVLGATVIDERAAL